MHWCAFFSDVASGVVSGVVAGALVLYGGYWLIDRKVHLRDALDRQRERDAQNEQNRRAALGAVHAELESNAARYPVFLKTIREGVARRYRIPVANARKIAIEGTVKNWPLPPPP
jgi:hypothetical protein